MIRQRLLLFSLTMLMVVTICLTPISAQAATAFQPTNNYRVSSQMIHNTARLGHVYLLPYLATAQVNNKTVTMSFSTMADAMKWGQAHNNAVVINIKSDQVIYSSVSQPYAVEYLQTTGSTAIAPTQSYATYALAIAAASQSSNISYVVNLVTGAVLWSNVQGNYVVQGNSSSAQYQFLADALSAAATQPTTSVVNVASGQIVWNAAYQVNINGSFSKSFFTLSDAQAYAVQNAMSDVIDNSTGTVVWSNIPNYDVYQNGILVKQFALESDAIAYAQASSNTTVVDISTQQTVYTNAPSYTVEVGTQTEKSFVDEASAIAYAKTLSGAVVIQISTNQVVWSSVGLYGVYRYLQLVRSFTSEQSAISFAKTLDHVQVINTKANQVVYSNYPTNVTSPNGDTFTVQNNMLIDQWGKENITWAPAPSFMTTGQTYVTEDYTHWYEVESSGDVYVGNWENPYRTMNLMTPSNLTANQINSFIASHAVGSSVLQNKGAYFIEAEKQFGVNAQYLVAHAIIESGWGTSNFAKNRDNLFGYEAYTSNPNAAATFRSIEYDINFEAWFVRNDYLDSNGSFFNGPNLDGMNVDYATDPYWSNSIARIMSEIASYSPSLANQPLMPELSTRVVFPYPPGATGNAVNNIVVYSSPNDATATPQVVGNIAKGASFPVLGDTPGWDEVTLPNKQTGFVNWNLVSLENVMEVTGINYGSTLGIHSATVSSNSNILDSVSNGVYLVLINNAGNGWDYVVDGNGKTGWVSNQNVMQIH